MNLNNDGSSRLGEHALNLHSGVDDDGTTGAHEAPPFKSIGSVLGVRPSPGTPFSTYAPAVKRRAPAPADIWLLWRSAVGSPDVELKLFEFRRDNSDDESEPRAVDDTEPQDRGSADGERNRMLLQAAKLFDSKQGNCSYDADSSDTSSEASEVVVTAVGALNRMLLQAVRSGNLHAVCEIVLAGADLSCKDEFGASPLGLAAECGHAMILAFLLTRGADFCVVDTFGRRPLSTATINKHPGAVAVLLSVGADVNATNDGLLDGDSTPLMQAARHQSVGVAPLLLQAGADLETRDRGKMTAFLLASRSGCAPIVKELLQAGADIAAEEELGLTGLMLAVSRTKYDCDTLVALLAGGARFMCSDAEFESMKSKTASLDFVYGGAEEAGENDSSEAEEGEDESGSEGDEEDDSSYDEEIEGTEH